MRVEALALEDFRNYRKAAVEFAGGLNWIVGRNAQGKTNLLEAVHCLSGLGSPRAPDAAVVRNDAERALLHAGVRRQTRVVRVDVEIRPGRGTRALVNKVAVPGTRSLAELTVCVFFGPDELALVKGGPDLRRSFLDDLAVKLRPARFGLKRELDRVLRQRNALLKGASRPLGPAATGTLEVWDESLCRVGAAVTVARLEVLRQLLPHVQKRYSAISRTGGVELQYSSSWVDEEVLNAPLGVGETDEKDLHDALARELVRMRSRELERGISLVGPHRDDVVVSLTSGDARSPQTVDARAFASQGEQRTCALAVKLAEYDLITETLDEEPILLLDDVFSELDPMRRQSLAREVRSASQALISSADPSADAPGGDRVVEVVAGELRVRG